MGDQVTPSFSLAAFFTGLHDAMTRIDEKFPLNPQNLWTVFRFAAEGRRPPAPFHLPACPHRHCRFRSGIAADWSDSLKERPSDDPITESTERAAGASPTQPWNQGARCGSGAL